VGGRLFSRLALPRELMPDLAAPGSVLGELRASLQKELGLGPVRVVAPATHDTASAVAGTPLQPGWAFVSSGTWSLVGVERGSPLVNDAVARANFTNEGGVFGTVRLLKTSWASGSSTRAGRSGKREASRPTSRASSLPPRPSSARRSRLPRPPALLQPGEHDRGGAGGAGRDRPGVPDDPARLARVVLDSLAFRYASVARTVEALTGERLRGLHIVGGGCHNDYLNQATAEALGLPVQAGPAEATAAGNVLLQALASGRLASLDEAGGSWPGRRGPAASSRASGRDGGRRPNATGRSRGATRPTLSSAGPRRSAPRSGGDPPGPPPRGRRRGPRTR